MSLILLLALQAAGPPDPSVERYAACVRQVGENAAAAERSAEAWRTAGGGAFARQCLGLALSAQSRFPAAAAAFEEAARAAEAARDQRAATLWAQAGNAWLASGDAAKARGALDAALAAGTLAGLERGEALLDRARALTAANQTAAARIDLDAALILAPADPLAWLLSATLARRGGDLPRAKRDIAEALRRSADDASVQLEAGNIAAAGGDEAGARSAWSEAARLAPDRDAGRAAVAALRQFDAPTTPVPPPPMLVEGR